MMSRVKSLNLPHAYLRAAERCGWKPKQAEYIMKSAQKHGLTSNDPIEDEKLKKFLTNRQKHTFRRIKYYKGYIFVFASTSTKCYTVYPYPYEKEKEEGQTDERFRKDEKRS